MDNQRRDKEIYDTWIGGQDYKDLAITYSLSADTIKKICTSQVPPSIKKHVWQGMHQYAKFRAWMRKQRGLPEPPGK